MSTARPDAAAPTSTPVAGPVPAAGPSGLRVRVDQDRCTGDGLCVQYAPEVFEFDIDGLAYVKGPDGELVTAAGGTAPVPAELRLEVIDSARECPGECIHVAGPDGAAVAGPDPAPDAAPAAPS